MRIRRWNIARVWGGLPVGVIGATIGAGGTRLGQLAFAPVLRVLKTQPWHGELVHAAKASDLFDDDLNLKSEDMRETLRRFMSGFVAFAKALPRRQ